MVASLFWGEMAPGPYSGAATTAKVRPRSVFKSWLVGELGRGVGLEVPRAWSARPSRALSLRGALQGEKARTVLANTSGRPVSNRRPSAWEAGLRPRLFYGIRIARARLPLIIVYTASPDIRSSEGEPDTESGTVVVRGGGPSTLLISSP